MRYKLTLFLDTPVSLELPTFDGLLSALLVQKIYDGVVIQNKYYSQDEMSILDALPITKHSSGAYLASKAMANFTGINFEEVIHKHYPQAYVYMIDFAGKARTINTGAGEFKSAIIPFTCTDVSEVYYIFESDNITEVEELIGDYLFGIGKKHNKGKGVVKSWRVHQTDEPIQRNMPIDLIPEYNFKVVSNRRNCVGWKAPYWLPENIELCNLVEM